jgi:hypothetical protein
MFAIDFHTDTIRRINKPIQLYCPFTYLPQNTNDSIINSQGRVLIRVVSHHSICLSTFRAHDGTYFTMPMSIKLFMSASVLSNALIKPQIYMEARSQGYRTENGILYLGAILVQTILACLELPLSP